MFVHDRMVFMILYYYLLYYTYHINATAPLFYVVLYNRMGALRQVLPQCAQTTCIDMLFDQAFLRLDFLAVFVVFCDCPDTRTMFIPRITSSSAIAFAM